MKVIFNVEGKIFYTRRAFKQHLLKTGNVTKGYPAKLGSYWMTAYLERTKKRTAYSKKEYYDVKLHRNY